jgi:hypothetical protein
MSFIFSGGERPRGRSARLTVPQCNGLPREVTYINNFTCKRRSQKREMLVVLRMRNS